MVLQNTSNSLRLVLRTAKSENFARYNRLFRHRRLWNPPSTSHDVPEQSTTRVRSSIRVASVTALIVGTAVSIYVREWRNQKLEELLRSNELNDESIASSSTSFPRTADDLFIVVERSGLMGKMGAKSVKDELEDIRQWHVNHGYKGGLVLRELLQPLFDSNSSNSSSSSSVSSDEGDIMDGLAGLNLPRRECYYLYYEITPRGEIKHEIFCRGTNLTVDVWTSLMMWMEYDEDLGCRVHMGFNQQANHILADILPLLAPPSARTTVRVSGHSLGGAVAYLLAAKLRQRGYRVVQVTAVEAPRVCATQAGADILRGLLPDDTIRIENDTDPVPLLPPFGHTVGNKLLLVDDTGAVAYLPHGYDGSDDAGDDSRFLGVHWTDSVFINARVWEILKSRGRTHRVPYILAQLKATLGPVKTESTMNKGSFVKQKT